MVRDMPHARIPCFVSLCSEWRFTCSTNYPCIARFGQLAIGISYTYFSFLRQLYRKLGGKRKVSRLWALAEDIPFPWILKLSKLFKFSLFSGDLIKHWGGGGGDTLRLEAVLNSDTFFFREGILWLWEDNIAFQGGKCAF